MSQATPETPTIINATPSASETEDDDESSGFPAIDLKLYDERVTSFIKHLRAENQQYSRHFEVLKKKYIDLFNSSHEQQQRWQLELHAKSQDFDNLRQQFDRDTRQLESIQSKLVEELEIRARLEKDLSEADRIRDQYGKLRRDFELYKNEKETELAAKQKQLTELQTELREWKQQQGSLQIFYQQMNNSAMLSGARSSSLGIDGSAGPTSAEEAVTIRSLQNLLRKQQEEYETRIDALRKEIKTLTNEKSDAVASKEELQMIHAKQMGELLASLRQLESDVQRLTTRNKQFQDDLEVAKRGSDQQHDMIVSLEREIFTLRAEKQNLISDFNNERMMLREALERERRESERKKAEQDSTHLDLNRQLKDAQGREKRLSEQLAESVSKSADRVKRLQVEFKDELKLQQTKEESLQQQLSSMEHTLQQVKAERMQEVTALQKENTALTNNLSHLELEHQQLSDLYEKLEIQVSNCRRAEQDREQQIKQLREELNKRSKQEEQRTLQANDMSSTNQRLDMTVSYLQKQLRETEQELQRSKSQKQELVTQASDNLASLQLRFEKRLAELEHDVDKYKTQSVRYARQLEKLKDKCKQKLKTLEQQKSFLNQQLEQQTQQLSDVKAQLSAVEAKSQKQVSLLERQRDRLQMLVEQQQLLGSTSQGASLFVADAAASTNSRLSQSTGPVSDTFDSLYASTMKQAQQFQQLHERVANLSSTAAI